MQTHENAKTDAEKLDFCWDNRYVQMNNTYSDTSPNGSPFQAFRAGFREGVKMTLDRGQKAISGKIENNLHSINYKRLLIWATIGADADNGQWAIFGTRLGIYKTNIEKDFDISQISDYDWFKSYFKTEIEHLDPLVESAKLLGPLKKILGINIADMNSEQSEFFKSVYEAPRRTVNPIVTEMEAKQ
jgi:hypothetical protein